MLVLEDGVTIKDLEPYGFHSFKQDGFTRYYRCLSRGCKLILISVADRTTTEEFRKCINRELLIDTWYDNDPRIHKTPKCKYKSLDSVEDVIHDLTKAGLIKRG